MSKEKLDIKTEQRIAEIVMEFPDDPLGFVKTVFPWGHGDFKGNDGPRKWQESILQEIGRHLQDEGKRFTPLQIAIASGHGCGKSALISMVCCWAMSTMPDCKVVVTAGTETQLRTKTWPEVSKWFRNMINAHWFTQTAMSVYSAEPDRDKSWRMDAVPWSENNTEAFAGLHNEGKRIVLVMDEGSSISDKVYEVAMGALTDSNTQIIWLVFGNPTRNVGYFRECFRKFKHRWITRQIDSRTVEGTNKDYFQQIVDDYGEDSDVVKIRVRGEFPSEGENQFIGTDIVQGAMTRMPQATLMDPLVMGVDVARYGCFDDKTEILTNDGWKLFSDLYGSEKVLTLNKENDNIEYGDITQVHKYKYDGLLNLYEKRNANFCITDNHNLYVRSNPISQEYVLKKYEDIANDFVLKNGGNWIGTEIGSIKFVTEKLMPHGGFANYEHVFSGKDWAEFMGWFLSEGNVYEEKRKNGRLRILIAQNPGAKQEKIKELLTRMGIKFRIAAKNKQLEFTSQSIGRHLIDKCNKGAGNKIVPDYIKNASVEEMELFLDAYLDGDGTKKKNGQGRSYTTSSIKMANDIQEMLAKLGRAGKLSIGQHRGSEFFIDGRKSVRLNNTYVVYEVSKNQKSKDKYISKKHAQKVYYKGFVWCVSTPHKTILVRRNGVVMWSGNSDNTVIVLRRGRDAKTIPWVKMSGANTMEVADRVMALYNQYKPDAIFVDGGGVGGGVIDRLAMMKYPVIEVQFGANALGDSTVSEGTVGYKDRASEMWGKMRDWLRGGAIPDDMELMSELTSRGYGHVFYKGKEVIKLQSKDSLKAMGLPSPDKADALALTFAHDIWPSDHTGTFSSNKSLHSVAYNPLSREHIKIDSSSGMSQHKIDYTFNRS